MKIKLTKKIEGWTRPVRTIILDFTNQAFIDSDWLDGALTGKPQAVTIETNSSELRGRRTSLLQQGWQETVIYDEEDEIEDILNKFAA